MMNKVKFLPLEEPCKTMIAKELCLGCQRLDDPNWTGKYCKWANEQVGNYEQIRIKEEK